MTQKELASKLFQVNMVGVVILAVIFIVSPWAFDEDLGLATSRVIALFVVVPFFSLTLFLAQLSPKRQRSK